MVMGRYQVIGDENDYHGGLGGGTCEISLQNSTKACLESSRMSTQLLPKMCSKSSI